MLPETPFIVERYDHLLMRGFNVDECRRYRQGCQRRVRHKTRSCGCSGAYHSLRICRLISPASHSEDDGFDECIYPVDCESEVAEGRAFERD